jgi:hypothetical protein
MANSIIYSTIFINKTKVYKKKHSSIVDELRELEASVLKNPQQGNNLGAGLFKIRLAVKVRVKEKVEGIEL